MNFNLCARRVARGGIAVAALLALAGCGGIADDAPTDADPAEFCSTFYDETLTAQEVAQKLADLGSPDDLTDGERKGFEVYVDGLDDEGDSANKDITEVQIPAGDREDGKAFVDYARDTCATLVPSEPSTGPSEPAATESTTP